MIPLTSNSKKLNIPCIIFALSLSIALSLSACNMPNSSDTSLSDEELAGTFVAQTIAAVEAQRPTKTIAPTNTATNPPPTATFTPTMTASPTYAVPFLSFEGDTNCRSGPGLDYEIIYTYKTGAEVEIIGKHPSSDFWVVKDSNSAETCWVTGEYTSASGSLWAVPTVVPPPTSTPTPPKAPTLQTFNYSCAWNGTNSTMTMSMEWRDWADNESGYRIYRNGIVVADLGANTITYTDIFAVAAEQTVNYGIEAYNSTGSSGQATFSASCQ